MKNLSISLLSLWLTVSGVSGRSIPTEDFARLPAVSQMQLSPDGRTVAFTAREEGSGRLFFLDLESGKTHRVNEHLGGVVNRVTSYSWVGSRRVYYQSSNRFGVTTGASAMDIDGQRWVGLGGADAEQATLFFSTNILHNFRGTDWLLTSDVALGSLGVIFRDLAKLNHVTGEFQILEKNPGNILEWGIDREGHLRYRSKLEGSRLTYQVRQTESSPWRDFAPPSELDRGWQFLAFDGAGNLYISGANAGSFGSVYRVDFANPHPELIFEAPHYDVVPRGISEVFDRVALNGLVFSPLKKELLGVRYETDRPVVHWFDSRFLKFQRELDQALPNLCNVIASISDDEKRLLVLSYSDRNPGVYSLFDTEKGSIQTVAQRYPWLLAAELAPTRAFTFTARDGLSVPCNVTAPLGQADRNLPMIVLVHGGPWARDTWGFDPEVQFLANRGYAVLQVNYRGSTGYGDDFLAKGKNQAGGRIEEDISDGAHWAIQSGLADPKRVAIMGASYGGFSTLWALGHEPDLYQCGVAMSAPADWGTVLGRMKRSPLSTSYFLWRDMMVIDKANKSGNYQETSAIAAIPRFKAPVLIVNGSKDLTVPIDQNREIIGTLNHAHKKYESLTFLDEGHGVLQQENRIELLKRIEKFLKMYLPADSASPQAPEGG